jgi:hypothetical protein
MPPLFSIINDYAQKNGHKNFCTDAAITIASGVDFNRVHETQRKLGLRKSKTSSGSWEYFKTLNFLGFDTKRIRVPVGAKTNRTLVGKLPKNKSFIVEYKGHVAAYVNGRIEDWSDGRCNRVRSIIEVTRSEDEIGKHICLELL